MSEAVPKYDGNIENFQISMKFIETAMGALQFKQETSQGKKVVDIKAIFSMGVYLHELPPKDLEWDKWDMRKLIERTEKAGKPITDRIKLALINLEKDIGEAEHIWVPSQNAAKEIILKFVSPNLSEVLNDDGNDPFSASRLIWNLYRSFNAQVIHEVPRINKAIIAHIETFTKASQTKSEVAAFFSKLNQLLQTGATVKKRLHREEFLVSEIIAKLCIDSRVHLQILGRTLRKSPKEISLEELAFQIKNEISDVDADADLPSLPPSDGVDGTQPSSFFAKSNGPQPVLHAYYGAQKSTRRNFNSGSSSGGNRSFNGKFERVAENRMFPRVPNTEWASWSPKKRRQWIDLTTTFKNDTKRMLKGKGHFNQRNPKREAAEEAEIATASESFSFPAGADAFLAEIQEATPQCEEAEVKSEKALVAATLNDKLVPTLNAVDSGCTIHMYEQSEKFTSMRPHKIDIATAKEGEVIQSVGIGDIRLTTKNKSGEFITLILKNVLYVPQLHRNLISCSALRKDNYQVVLPPPENEKGVFPAGVYNCREGFDPELAIPILQVGNLFFIESYNDLELDRSEHRENLYHTWSRRLGHSSIAALRSMISTCDGLDDLKKSPIPHGYVSPEMRVGKATKVDVPRAVEKRANKPMEKVHMDIKGPCRTPSFQGHKYAVIFVDDCTHFSWVTFIASKADLFQVVKRFYADTAPIRLSHPWCCLRCDNAGENSSDQLKNWLIEKGVRLETSTPHEPWQNGRAEVHIRHLMSIARTSLTASGLGGRFWARAVSYANDVSNVQPRGTMKMTPFQGIFGTKPDVRHFQSFGVECWLYVREEQRADRTFDARGEPAIYVGRATADGRSSHVCYTSSNRFVFTNNVRFGKRYPMNKDAFNIVSEDDTDSNVLGFPSPVNADEASMIASIVAQNESYFVVALTSGIERTMSKRNFVDHFLQNDLKMAGFEVPEQMRALLCDFYLLEDMNIMDHASETMSLLALQSTASETEQEPRTYREAMLRSDADKWQQALDAEMAGLFERNVFRVVDPPKGRTVLDTTVVFKRKVDPVTGTIVYKARLCLRGDQQKEGTDYFKHKTYSAVLNSRENRVIYALAAGNSWNLMTSDITQAFTYGKLDVELFCHPPSGYKCPAGKILALNNALYGCIQASACFKKCYCDFLLKDGFKPMNGAETIFKKQHNDSFVIASIFVDDSLNATNDSTYYRDFRKKFEKYFKVKTNDHIDVFLGIRVIVDKSKKSISLNQQHYIEACLQKFGLASCHGVCTPITERLSVQDQPETPDLKIQSVYREMVGSLLYISSWTRPDIAFAVSELSRFVSNPGSKHLAAAKRVFRYLKETISDGIIYHPPLLSTLSDGFPLNILWGYVDSDWAGCPDTRRSTSGFALMLNEAAVSWRSKRQPTVALSSAEAEYISGSSLVQEVIYLRKLLNNLGFPQQEPTVIFADNETCIAWSEGSVGGSDRAKHLDLRVHFLHEAVQAGHLVLRKIDTKLNCSDLFTKPSISADQFALFRRRLMGF